MKKKTGCNKWVDDGTESNTGYICGKTKITDMTKNPIKEYIYLCEDCKNMEKKNGK